MSINAQTYTQREIVPVHPGHELSLPVRLSSNLNLQCGSLVREVTAAAANMIQRLTITGSPTGGTYVLSFMGQTTTALAHNANAVAIQAALRALPLIGNNVNVTGTGPFDVEFVGELAALPQQLFVLAVNGLTGGSTPSVTIAQQQAAVPQGRFIQYDGTGVPRILRYDVSTNHRAQMTYGQTATPQLGQGVPLVSAFVAGTFRRGDILDAGQISGAITAWGARYIAQNGASVGNDSILRIP